MSDDPRLGDHILPLSFTDKLPSLDIGIIGFPYDEGVRRNHGRLGSSKGPACFRSLYSRMGALRNGEYEVDLKELMIVDCGDVPEGLELEEAHGLLALRVGEVLEKNGIPFVIGGGNDQSYPNAAALLKYCVDKKMENPGDVTVINIDAHLDVRPLKNNKVHSGSPFRCLLEDERFNGYFLEFAAQGSQCSMEHVKYLNNHVKNNKIVWFLKDIRNNNVPADVLFINELNNTKSHSIFTSFDIDSICSDDCPGVSCPATIGLSSLEALRICYAAGLENRVKLFDLSEFNPEIDSYRTGRLVVNMFYYFAMGVCKRKLNQ